MDPKQAEQMLDMLKTIKGSNEASVKRIDELGDKVSEQAKSATEFGETVSRLVGVSETNTETMKALGERMDALEKGIKSRRVSVPGCNDGENEGKFMFSRAIAGMSTNDWRGCEFEKEVLDTAREKALSQGVDTAGGHIVPEEYVAELIELFRARTVVEFLGATVMRNLTGSPIDIPRQDGGATASWTNGENVDLAESDLTLDDVQMTPKRLGCFTKVSNRLLRMGNPDAETLVRRDLATAMALARDLAALRGSGASGQPTGIVNIAGVLSSAMGTNGGVVGYDDLVDLVGLLEDANALLGKPGFAMPPAIRRMIQKIKDADNRPLFQSATAPASIKEGVDILGYDYATTTQMPKNLTKGSSSNLGEIIFGNWEELIIGEWTGLLMDATTKAADAFTKSQTWLKIEQELDIQVRHPNSFAMIPDAATTDPVT